MTELWSVIGLAMLDRKFNEELKEARDDLKKLGEEVEEYGFRLSCYELVELQRIISAKVTNFPAEAPEDALELMYYMSTLFWVIHEPCWWAWWKAVLNPDLESIDPKHLAENPKLALNLDYQHPYMVFDEKTGKNVPGAVDPQTGDPINNELFDKQVNVSTIDIQSDAPKRFGKAKNLEKGKHQQKVRP